MSECGQHDFIALGVLIGALDEKYQIESSGWTTTLATAEELLAEHDGSGATITGTPCRSDDDGWSFTFNPSGAPS